MWPPCVDSLSPANFHKYWLNKQGCCYQKFKLAMDALDGASFSNWLLSVPNREYLVASGD